MTTPVLSTQIKLLGQLRSARATQTFERRFQALAKTDLLIINDFGLSRFRPTSDEDFHHLIAEHSGRHPIIITNNLEFPEWGETFPNRLLGSATLDRLGQGAYWVILEGINVLAKEGEKHKMRPCLKP